MAEEGELSKEARDAAENLDSVLSSLQKHFSEGLESENQKRIAELLFYSHVISLLQEATISKC